MSDLKNLALTILLWSGVITLLSGAGLAAFITYERTRQHEKTEEDAALEEAGIAPVDLNFLAIPLLAAPVLIAAVAFGVGVTGYVVVVALSVIQTGNPFISILFVAGAILLYGMRTRYPFVYGFIEVVVGVSAIIYVVLANQQPASNAAPTLCCTTSQGSRVSLISRRAKPLHSLRRENMSAPTAAFLETGRLGTRRGSVPDALSVSRFP